ncbi:unnamed protein product [Cuscuta epithymum]|uniref:Uncharacterized protein n=1 Tax=Cuscuta epithymum TaxID=186058 RepID=A0AAV0DN48_9ASTE|nr:unnamed protein product [Cuscuta epithymum]
MTKPFGPWLRASGRSSKFELGSKWLITEGSSSGDDMHLSKLVKSGQEWVPEEKGESIKVDVGKGAASGELEEGGLIGELKRRRTWEDQMREGAGWDAMALDSPKNGDGAGAAPQPRQRT